MGEMIHPYRAGPVSQPTGSAERLSREVMAEYIAQRIEQSEADLARQWRESLPINHFVLDDLLPVGWAESIRRAFPGAGSMFLKKSLRELKYVAAQMDRYDPLLEEAIYAFQAPRIVSAIERITGLRDMEPDEMLYAGGLSLMAPGHFLNPHIDNSHDRFRRRYRILNLLYYVSPQWPEQRGGNLELWPAGLRGCPTTIVSKFNRLVVMITHKRSWHSVSRNLTAADRCCVSNYFFSRNPIGGADYYHVTEFRGRPEQPLRDMALRADNWLRTVVRTKFPKAFKNPHFYLPKAATTPSDDSRSNEEARD
jgi:Rps23 Pro-64 3,4-dihydroxylase Tpa1-like proline 4-hydroxylase